MLQNLREAIAIADVAERLGVISKGSKLHCFNTNAHSRGDKNPSLVLLDRVNRFQCYGCGEKGSTIDLVKGFLGYSVREAIEWLEHEFDMASSEMPAFYFSFGTKSLKRTPEYQNALDELLGTMGPARDAGLSYLQNRKISGEVVKKNRVGFFDPKQEKKVTHLEQKLGGAKFSNLLGKESVLFPIRYKNKTIGIQARFLQTNDYQGKYFTVGDTCLYNSDSLESTQDGDSVYLCEGIMDCLTVLSEGDNAVAILGAESWKDSYVFELSRFHVVVATDMDVPGERAAGKIMSTLVRQGIKTSRLRLSNGYKDVNEAAVMGW